MKNFRTLARSLAAGCLGSAAALVVFGLLLALAWSPADPDHTGYKLSTLLLATALAFLLGGLVTAWVAGRKQAHAGLFFGVVLGLVAFGYILGAHWSLLIAVPLAGLLGALGGRLAHRPPNTA